VKYLFDNLDQVRQVIKCVPFGLFTDVDGTISPIAETPQQAVVWPKCRRFLKLLSRSLPLVAAISGRDATTLKNMVKVPGMVYIGNHGLERWAGRGTKVRADLSHFPAVTSAALAALEPRLKIDGVRLENKGLSASVHYRLAADPEAARQEILARVKELPQANHLKVLENKMVVDLLPNVAADKGTALIDLILEYRLGGGIYMGDDITDICAFRALHQTVRETDFKGYALGVAGTGMPPNLAQEADFTLNGVADVARFLEWLYQVISQSS
jgi:trehalose 6-phosphate phosphatase